MSAADVASGAAGGPAARTRAPRPWIETDQLETYLAAVEADGEEVAFCRELAETGVALIDLGAPGRDLCDRVIAETDGYFAGGDVGRVQDAWLRSKAVRTLALHPAILRRLELAYGRKPIPFQTLSFHRGSEQDVHSDTIHFHSVPERFMCGVWIALEDVTADSGPLTYLPGSQKLPVLTMQGAGVNHDPPTPIDYARHYLPALQARLTASGLSRTQALPKKGQALVWAANLAHGGAPIRDPAATRRSLVVHVFFENCLFHTPMLSNPAQGRYRTRLPLNISTGRWVWPSRNGRPVAVPRGALIEAVLRRLTRRPIVHYKAGSSR